MGAKATHILVVSSSPGEAPCDSHMMEEGMVGELWMGGDGRIPGEEHWVEIGDAWEWGWPIGEEFP